MGTETKIEKKKLMWTEQNIKQYKIDSKCRKDGRYFIVWEQIRRTKYKSRVLKKTIK